MHFNQLYSFFNIHNLNWYDQSIFSEEERKEINVFGAFFFFREIERFRKFNGFEYHLLMICRNELIH